MAGTYQLVITASAAGEFMQNVLHFKLDESGAGTPFDYALALCNQFVTDILTPWEAMQSDQVIEQSIKAKKISGTGGATAIVTFASGDQIGANAGPIGDAGQAILLNFPVVLNSKNVTGKIFLAGIRAEDIQNNRPSSLMETNAGTLGTALLGTLALAGGLGNANFTIFNKATGLDTEPPGMYVSPLIGTQRRRLHPV
jgi:hypothetical protein